MQPARHALEFPLYSKGGSRGGDDQAQRASDRDGGASADGCVRGAGHAT